MGYRKTIDVADVLDRVNQMLAETTCSSESRKGMAAVLENILHMTGNYAGYNHLPSAGVKNPGTREVSFEDESRRVYHRHRRLPPPTDTR